MKPFNSVQYIAVGGIFAAVATLADGVPAVVVAGLAIAAFTGAFIMARNRSGA